MPFSWPFSWTKKVIPFLAILLFPPSVSAEERGRHDQRVNRGMALVSVLPGAVRTSPALTVRVDGVVPDGAVVERVSVVTGNVASDKRVAGAVVVETYNIKGPGMERFIGKRWAGRNRPTVFDADELGGQSVPVKGTWQISMTGNNVGRVRGTVTHTVRALEITYSDKSPSR